MYTPVRLDSMLRDLIITKDQRLCKEAIIDIRPTPVWRCPWSVSLSTRFTLSVSGHYAQI